MRGGCLLLMLLAGCSTAPESTPDRVVVLFTDFGLQDDAVGLMRGVIHGIAPGVALADLTHQAPRFDVRAGTRLLADAPGIYPAGSVFVVVIDPGVGTERRALVARLPNGSLLVAPDNGVLTEALARHGPAEVRAITNRALLRSEMSTTFHGRDVFAPVGGHLAAGVEFAEVGPLVEDWIRLEPQLGTREGAVLRGTVVSIDEPFGNLWTDLRGEWLAATGAKQGQTFQVVFGEDRRMRMPWVATFGDVPEGAPLLYANSRGAVALALNMRDFARTHGIEPGTPVRIEPLAR